MSTANGSRSRLLRTRWAAIGAAVAVTLGAGGLYSVGATSTSSSFVAIDPVRVLDTRSDVGLSGAFSSDVARKLDVTATAQSPVPEGATAVVANVTVVSPSTLGFVAVRPGDAIGLPSTSSLNFAADEVAPNSVTVALPTIGANIGQIDLVFHGTDPSATAHLLIDIVGYYQPAAAGTAGPQGATGERGISAWDVIPSGQTVTGEVIVQAPELSANRTVNESVSLPGVAPEELIDSDVNFAPVDAAIDGDPSCTGDVDNPTAPAGTVCIYAIGPLGSTFVLSAFAGTSGKRGFYIAVTRTADGEVTLPVTWAYTAP